MDWLEAEHPAPYGSYGNGSAMRVSSAGWLFNTLEDVEYWAEIIARVTHNHPDGIKGAQATAAAIFLARTEGADKAAKNRLRTYIVDRFGYNLSRTIKEIRPDYYHVESCQESVPEAITAYLESKDFEHAIRLVVSLGGDTDTLGAITGSIAEAAYGVPENIRNEALKRLPAHLRKVLDRFLVAQLWSLLAPYADFFASRPKTPFVHPFYTVYDERISALEHQFYAHNIMDHDYDATLERYHVEKLSEEIIASANIELIRAMFTRIFRGERFCTGTIASVLEKGFFDSLTLRVKALAERSE
ncbi:hypothetical protein AGMMS50256_15460 [Betaproteobacteria bacterium]|nr:hypothetical protein AGMMS50256_15460 [Betaproteobacteria bacterium]